MRLRSSASLSLAAAALLAAAPPVRAEPPAELPSCATDDRAFPLTTRIHGGPDSYPAGGGFGTWYLELTNTTGRTCTGIHPVVVLVDSERALKQSQPRLEFYARPDTRSDSNREGSPDRSPEAGPDAGRGGVRPHPVRFETTDEDELVAAFDGFPGFTVGPRKTLTVKVRLALTSDAVPNEVTANAAVVQRHDGDGDWVGQSNDYRFTIDAGRADPDAATDPADRSDPSAPAGRDPSADTAASTAPDTPASPSPSPSPSPAPDDLTLAEELARTGLTSPPGATLAAAAALLLTGVGLLLVRRRR